MNKGELPYAFAADFDRVRTTKEICAGIDVELLTTDAAKSRMNLELLDARLYVFETQNGKLCATAVKFNSARGLDGADVFAKVLYDRAIGRLRWIVEYQLKAHADTLDDFRWCLCSIRT